MAIMEEQEQKRIIELLTRKLAGEATEDELTELSQFSLERPDTIHLQDTLNEIWNSEPSMQEDAEFYYNRLIVKNKTLFDQSARSARVETRPRRPRRKWNYLIGIAATLLFVTLCWRLVTSYLIPVRKPGLTTVFAGKGVRKKVTLPDESLVWLNSETRVSFDPDLNLKNERIVELEGEAFFDVKHVSNRPFIIHTGKASIRVLGTAFDVKAYPDEKVFETTVIRGSVEIVTNNRTSQKFTLKPAQKLLAIEPKIKAIAGVSELASGFKDHVMIENAVHVTLSNKVYFPATSWTQNKLIFKNESLEELAPKFERWYNVRITIGSKEVAAFRYTGAFENETIEQALTAMKLIHAFNFSIHDNNITIY
jgi:transmembrane sensor